MHWIIIGILLAFGIWLGEGLIEVIKNMFSIGKPYIYFIWKHYGWVCITVIMDLFWLIILTAESGPLRTEPKSRRFEGPEKGYKKWVLKPLAILVFGGFLLLMNYMAYEEIQKAPEYISL